MTPWLLVQFNYQIDKKKKAVCASCDRFQTFNLQVSGNNLLSLLSCKQVGLESLIQFGLTTSL